MEESELVDAIAGDLFTYVLEGDLPSDDIAGVVKPRGLPEQYAEFETLVDLHFLLQDVVAAFVDTLPNRLRSITTDTTVERHTTRGGEVQGRIDWSATYRTRAAESPGDRSLFVTQSHEEAYRIPKNIVLKALVQRLARAVTGVDRHVVSNRSWVRESWVGDRRARDRFLNVVERNVHLNRIPDPRPNEPTPRMLSRAAGARQELYRDASSLLQARQAYESDPEQLAELLQDTLITPSNRDRLFELYVLFRIIDGVRGLEHPAIGSPTYHTITTGRDAVADFAGSLGLAVFYDQVPSSPQYSFRAVPADVDPVGRAEIALEESRRAANTVFPEHEVRDHTGRPDVLVIGRGPDARPEQCLVVEVKDSARRSTIREGITELVEYLSFMRVNDDYVFAPGSFGDEVHGLLVVQDVPADGPTLASFANQATSGLPIRVTEAGTLNSTLANMLPAIFGS